MELWIEEKLKSKYALRERNFQKKPYDFAIDFSDDTWVEQSVSLEQGVLKINLWSNQTSNIMRMMNPPPLDLKESFGDFLNIWKDIIQKEDPDLVLLSGDIHWLFGVESHEILKEKESFFHLNSDQQKVAMWFDKSFKGLTWSLMIRPNPLSYYCQLFSVVVEELEKERKHDSVLDYSLDHLDKGKMELYVHGADTSFFFTLKEETCITEWEGKRYTVRDQEGMRKAIRHFLDHMRMGNEEKNKLHPPRKYFDLYAKHHLRVPFNEVLDQCHHLMLHFHSYQEIEEWAREEMTERNPGVIVWGEGCWLFHYKDAYYLCDKENHQVDRFEKEYQKEATNVFFQRCIERKEAYFKNKIQEFEDKLS